MFVGRSSARGAGEVIEEARADERPEGGLAQPDRAFDEVDGGNSVLAVRADVVADHERAVGPPHEHRPLEGQLIDDGSHVIGPELAVRVVLRLERRLGHPVAAQIVGHEPKLVGQLALVLLGPAEVVLRPAVNEQDRRPVRPPPLADVQLQAAAAPHRVGLHPPSRLRLGDGCLLRDVCHRLPPFGRRRSWPRRAGSASGEEAYLSPPAYVSSERRCSYAHPRAGVCAQYWLAWMLARATCSSGA